ncbi:MAG: DNA primase [Gammaproteobacteria bacterium]
MAGLIPQDFIDDLIARADIVELIGRRVRLKRQGHEFAALCPFHEEKTPSFTVSPQKQFFHCFGCGAHGTAIGFLMRYEHLEFPEAVERLAGELGLEVPHEGGTANPHTALYEALARAQRLFGAALGKSGEARNYLESRGLDQETISAWGIGYAPGGGETLFTALAKEGLDEKTLTAAGLVSRSARGAYDRFRDRVTFPIHDTRGRAVGFGARALGEATPKYLNSPETPVFHKGRLLYGLYEARQVNRKLERLVVVEGYMDVIGLARAGFTGAVATLGTAVTETQARLLFGTGADEVIYCFDGDAAGQRAAWRALEQTLPALAPERAVRFAFLPAGEDPDSLARRAGLPTFERILSEARPLSEWLLDHLATGGVTGAEERARFAGRFKPLANRIRDSVFREVMLSEAAARAGLPLARFERLMEVDPQERRRNGTGPSRQRTASNKPRTAAISLDPRIKTLLCLLLAEPDAIAGEPWPRSLERLDIPGAGILREMLEILEASPHLSTAGILEHWRDRPEAAILGRLAATSPPATSDGQTADLPTELRATLAGLEREPRRARLTALKRLAAERELDAAEKQELYLLYQIQALEGKADLPPAEREKYAASLAEYESQRAAEMGRNGS